MRNWSVRVACVVLLLFVGHASTLAQTVSTPSVWKNKRNSLLTILSVDGNGAVHGLYTNYAPGTECIGVPFGVDGKVIGADIVFAVTFTPCRTVTVWRGRFVENSLDTLFEAAYPSKGHIQIWRGKDSFTRQ